MSSAKQMAGNTAQLLQPCACKIRKHTYYCYVICIARL